jgi:uncharacterized protein (TIGR04168 family)
LDYLLTQDVVWSTSSVVSSALTIALIGDLHGYWSDADVAYFNASDYALLLFTGDLGSGTRKNGVDIARSLARLDKRALVVAGNNDAPHRHEIAAEFRLQGGLTELMRLAPGHALAEQREGNVALCGYSVHEVRLGERALSLVVGRPYAMGGNELSFPQALREGYGIASMAESSERLCALVEQAASSDVVFLAHNGPLGLGEAATSIWGCDFRPEGGDWGDEDLRRAVQHAARVGKRVVAVVAGHMHRSKKLPRAATAQQEGVLFVNPAFVPRVLEQDDGAVRHHMVMELSGDDVTARDVFVTRSAR